MMKKLKSLAVYLSLCISGCGVYQKIFDSPDHVLRQSLIEEYRLNEKFISDLKKKIESMSPNELKYSHYPKFLQIDEERMYYIEKLLEPGIDIMHVNSCGPESLERVSKALGCQKNKIDFSQNIRSSNPFGNFLRPALSIFDERARQMTFPGEMKSSIEYAGFSIEICRGSHEKLKSVLEKMCANYEKGIVFLSKGMSYHWYPIAGKDEYNFDFTIEDLLASRYKINEIYKIVP